MDLWNRRDLPSSTPRNRWRWTARLAIVMLATLTASIINPKLGAAQEQENAVNSPGRVNEQASRVFVFVDKKGIGHQHGVEGLLSAGELRLGQGSDAGKLVFNMKSFDADTPRARSHFQLEGKTDDSTRSKVNANMRTYTLKPDRYPEATFVINSSLPLQRQSNRGLPAYELVGEFTLCGRTKPLRLVVDVEKAKGWLHIRGTFNIKQTDYGITPYSMALGAIGVADTLRIDGDLFVSPDPNSDLSEIPERSQP